MWMQRHKESTSKTHRIEYSSDESSIEELRKSAVASHSIPSRKNKWAAELVKYEETLGDQRYY